MLNYKNIKMTYLLSTILFSVITSYAIFTYIFDQAYYHNAFIKFGYPTYLIYPLALLKTLGLIAIWTKKSKLLCSLAYAGFFYNALLGFVAHISVGDNQQWSALLALGLMTISYFSLKRLSESGQH